MRTQVTVSPFSQVGLLLPMGINHWSKFQSKSHKLDTYLQQGRAGKAVTVIAKGPIQKKTKGQLESTGWAAQPPGECQERL